jgi:hypothetical protein
LATKWQGITAVLLNVGFTEMLFDNPLRLSGDTKNVSTEIISESNKSKLWSQSYDRELERQRCRKFTTQQMAYSVFKLKIIFLILKTLYHTTTLAVQL